MPTPYVRLSEPESSLRARLAVAFTEAASDFGTGDQIMAGVETLVDAALNVVTHQPRQDWAALLLERIQAEGGMWTGGRAASALSVHYGRDVVPERGVQLMRKLVERGQLVVANPPRGQTFTLPYGPGGDVEYEWANVLEHNGQAEIMPTGPAVEGGGEKLARYRMRHGWHTALLRREVKYGPWVEVAAEEKSDDA